MGWTRRSGRIARERRRPCLELLETRQLLSTLAPKPASGPTLNSDGSTNFDQIIGASAARSEFHVDGFGETVAVIDTGADFNNPALGGGLGAGHKIVAGIDFTGSPNGVIPTWQHGTGVAGLAAGSSGVAPGADIVALRVFGDNNSGSFNDIANALDWVVENHSAYNITAVNLSVSDGGNYTSNLFANTGVGQQITQDVSKLDALNIPVVMAAGNSFDGKSQGLGFPSIIPEVISVTATDATDQLASNAQRLGSTKGGASAVKIAAPGVGITAPSGDNGTTTEDGTSFATPQVTGSILLLQQMYENAYHTLPTIAVLDQLLQQGAVMVHDGATGIDVGRLDVLNSAQILNTQITSQSTSNSGSGTSSTGSTAATSSTNSAAATSTSNTTSASTTTTTSALINTAPPTEPLTQVFVNGVSFGNYATSQLAAKYPKLFAFLKGPVTTLRIWAPAGSSINLGPAPAASSAAAFASLTPKHPVTLTIKLAAPKVHAAVVSKVVPVVQHPAVHKKTSPVSTFFSNLFHFKI